MTSFWRNDINPNYEPNRVLIERGQWIDPNRNDRIVPYKIYYPDLKTDRPLPIIIWSHGLGGTQDGAGFIGRFLGSHGFIHVNIAHEGTNDSLWRGLPGHPWDNIRKAKIPWETVKNRYLDVPFALNSLEEQNLPIDANFKKIGMSGHSFGAATTQIMAGQLTGNPEPEDLSDSRFIAAIAYSPVPNVRLKKPANEIYSPIKIPLLHLTGTEDYSPLDGPIQHLRDEIFNHAGTNGALQMNVILNGADHMVFNGSRGQLPDYPQMDQHKDQIKILALAWWDYYLKDNLDAYNWMVNNVSSYLGKSSIVKVKNRD